MSTILVVDDDPVMRYLARLMVQKLGYHPVEATNGREGKSLALELQPALILLDIMMPVQDGYETIRHLRAQGYRGAITILSAIPEAEGPQTAKDCGATSYLSKPIDYELLTLHVQYAAVYTADPQHAPSLPAWLAQQKRKSTNGQ